MGSTGVERAQSPPHRLDYASSTAAGYAAVIAVFGCALVSLYWAAGGHGLESTVGG